MIKRAFLFPGQGSQFVGMGKDLTEAFNEAKILFDRANDVLGFNLKEICFNGPEETLKQTQFTQPALFVHSAVCAALLKSKGVVADAAAGHSLGEFSALAYAGVFSFEDGLRLVQQRAQCMQQAARNNPGTMAAIIGMQADEVSEICEEATKNGIVQPANFNSPGQIVISGSKEGVQAAIVLAKEKGVKRALELPVSGAFHSPLMEEAAIQFKHVLEKVTFNTPRIPVYVNVTGEAVHSETSIREFLTRQLTHSVQWVTTMQNMVNDGMTEAVEVGPGKVLAGLMKRTHDSMNVRPCGTVEDLGAFEE